MKHPRFSEHPHHGPLTDGGTRRKSVATNKESTNETNDEKNEPPINNASIDIKQSVI